MNKTDNENKPAVPVKALVVKVVLPVIILIAGGSYAWYMLNTSPKSKRQPPQKQARLVEVTTFSPADVPIKINAMGTVIPAKEVQLRPQVSGKIIEMNQDIIPGGILEKGQLLIKIEPADYELLVKQSQSDVAAAQSKLQIEQGNQAVAQQEYTLLEDQIEEEDKDLVLRKPQLISAQSTLETAKAKLDQAKLNLQRTSIISPFNAIVKEKHIDLGATVAPATPLVTLTGTNEYWIEVMVPVDQLKWITIPRQNHDLGSLVTVYNHTGWGNGTSRQGNVIRLSADIETTGRMAKLLVSVKDPLSLQSTENRQLLLGSYIRAQIVGQTIKSAFVIPRSLLHNGDNLWVYSKDQKLQIRPVKVVYRGLENVIVSEGIAADDKIVITALAAPVEGMMLRLN